MSSPTRFRPLTTADRELLAEFPCRDPREPWTTLVEDMVRVQLPDEIDVDAIETIGAFVGARLCGVAAWRVDPADGRVARSVVIAVRTGAQRRGLGRALKQATVRAATERGAQVLQSLVHFDNDAMIAVNASCGAAIQRVPGDPDHVICLVRLPPPG